MMKRTDFYFELPEKLIAQTPLKDRSSSRLLVIDKKTGELSHKKFTDVVDYMNKGDCLVINDTKVLPARIFGVKKDSLTKIEFLLLNRKDKNTWEVLTKPGRKARAGDIIEFGDGILACRIVDVLENGNRIVEFMFEGVFEEILDKLGEMPLPPYIKERLEDQNRYQTVYAKNDGSAAAPTAGLHFTEELLEKIRSKGINMAKVTLHVGLGTFRPVKADDILAHEMHSEFYSVDETQASIINDTKKTGGKIIAVGTTSCRTLESLADENGLIKHGSGYTNIFIYPGYDFKIVDHLITNFHLPESTLIMLISALCGRENCLHAYRVAVENEYRFFSFGDAMLCM